MKIEKNVGEGYKNDEITSNVLKNVEKNVGEGFSTWQKNVGEGWSEINPFTPRDTIKNGIALTFSTSTDQHWNLITA